MNLQSLRYRRIDLVLQSVISQTLTSTDHQITTIRRNQVLLAGLPCRLLQLARELNLLPLGRDKIQPVPQRHSLHNRVDLVKAVFTPTMQLQKKVNFGRCVDAELMTVLTN